MKLYTALTIPTMEAINALPKKFVAASLFSGCGGASIGIKLARGDVRYANEFVPIAAENYRVNAPGTFVDERDIRLVTPERILKACRVKKGELDYLDASPPCFPAGALVRTRDRGLVPIENIVCGDYVLTHRGRFRRVTNTMSRLFDGELHKFNVHGALEISCTAEHPLWIRRRYQDKTKTSGRRFSLKPPTWERTADVQNKNYVGIVLDRKAKVPAYDGFIQYDAFNRTTRQFDKSFVVKTLPLDQPAFWYLIGRWLGDGWLRYTEDYASKYINQGLKKRKNRYGFIICCKKPALDGGKELAQITRRFEELGWSYKVGFKRSIAKVTLKGQGYGQASLKSGITSPKELVLWCLQFGRGAENKRLTSDILNLPRNLLREVLRGYLSADGCSKERCFTYRSVSRELAQGVALALVKLTKKPCNRVRHTAGLQKFATIEGRIVRCRQQFICSWYKHEDLHRAHVVDDDRRIVWVPVKNMRTEAFRGTVYNISVEEDETYTVNGIAVHNCKLFSKASLHTKGDRDETKKVVYSEGIKQRVDDLFFEATRLLDGLQPKTFAFENVEGLTNKGNTGYLHEIFKAMRSCGYAVEARVIDGSMLGVPQKRRRLIFIGVRNDLVKKGFKPVFPKPHNKYITVRDVLPHAVKIKCGGGKGYVDANIPSQTITASDATTYETADFSCGAWVETADGERRKYTIRELKKVFGMPPDFKLLGTYEQKFERLGRIHLPLQVYALASAVYREVLAPYESK